MHTFRKKTLAWWLSASALLACASGPLQAADLSGAAMDRVAGQLKLTPEQRTALERILARWQNEREARAAPDLRQALLQQFAGDRLDADALAREATDRLRELEAAIPRMAADLAELHRALTPEQRIQLVNWMQERGTKRRWHTSYWHRGQ